MEHRQGLGNEACPYPYMAVPLIDEGEEVTRFGILKHVLPNDPCWCGSGNQFKHCYLGREEDRPVAPEALVHLVLQVGQRGLCMHPEASQQTCDRISAAHTVQRSRVLRAVADCDNKVMTFRRAEGVT